MHGRCSGRLPKSGASAASLFAALTAARRGETGRAAIKAGGAEHEALVSPLGAAPLPGAPDRRRRGALALPPAAMEVLTAFSGAMPPPPKVLDAFAAASPFGAALLEGEDPFEATIVEANPALKAVAGGGEKGQAFGELIEPASRADAAQKLAAGQAGAPLEVAPGARPRAASPTSTSPRATAAGSPIWWTSPSRSRSSCSSPRARRCRPSASWPAASPTTSTTCSPPSSCSSTCWPPATRWAIPSYEGLNEIKQTSTRAADLVRKLLAFSRKQTVQREILDLGELISEFEVLLRRVLYEDVKLTTDYGRNLPQVRADRGQLETAVMNLAVNARDAVRAHGGGQVKIRTARVTQEQAQAMGYAARPGRPGADRGLRRRPGHPARRHGQDLRPLLHHQAGGRGDGPGPRHRLRHRQAVGRLDRGGLQAGRGRGLPHLPAGAHPQRHGRRAAPVAGRAQAAGGRATSPAPAASSSSRTRTPCAASPPSCCAPAATR